MERKAVKKIILEGGVYHHDTPPFYDNPYLSVAEASGLSNDFIEEFDELLDEEKWLEAFKFAEDQGVEIYFSEEAREIIKRYA